MPLIMLIEVLSPLAEAAVRGCATGTERAMNGPGEGDASLTTAFAFGLGGLSRPVLQQ